MGNHRIWKVLDEKILFKSPFFSLRKERCQLPDQREMPAYYIFDFVDWVNVVAISENNKIIMVEQYRHASKDVYLEVPGGSVDPGTTESHEIAARRELLEETGFEPGEFKYLGFHNPNPALQSNKMHTYLALKCKKVADLDLDPFEDLVVKEFDISEIYNKLDNGELKHSIMIATLSLARPHIQF